MTKNQFKHKNTGYTFEISVTEITDLSLFLKPNQISHYTCCITALTVLITS